MYLTPKDFPRPYSAPPHETHPLRVGLDTAPAAGRTIVFVVSGYIPVVSDTNFDVPSKVTIAGQMAPGSWSPVGAPVAGNDSEKSFLHAGGVSGTNRFYRVAIDA